MPASWGRTCQSARRETPNVFSPCRTYSFLRLLCSLLVLFVRHLLRLAEHAANRLEEQFDIQREGLMQRILHAQAVLLRQDVLLEGQ